MGNQTLEELKAENAAAENEPVEVTATDTEVITEYAADTETTELDTTAESETVEGEEVEVDAWMQEGDQTPNSADTFTSSDVAAVRRKFKGKLGEAKTENEQLKAELERLKAMQGQPQQASAPQVGAAPTLEACDFDEGKYQQAMTEWVSGQVRAQVSAVQDNSAAEAAQAKQVKMLNDSVDQHYERAEKLATDSGITAEVYQQSDLAVRTALDSVSQGQGNVITDWMIAKLGPGSEKVMFYIGRNAAELDRVKASMVSDPSGLTTMVLLGELKSKVSAPQKRTSKAPKPAAQANGDAPASEGGNARKLREAYQKAHKSGNIQTAFDTKRKAKADGVDVTNW